MKPRILLVNPPIYDFAAYDFWLKPYGLLTVAGYLRQQADFELFDFLDRMHPAVAQDPKHRSDARGRGHYPAGRIPRPSCLDSIPRYFRRYGLDQALFVDFLDQADPWDICLIQSTMTYWYPGIKEVVRALRRHHPKTKIILGGPYAILCPDHARSLGVDHVITSTDLRPLWKLLHLESDDTQPPLWEIYPKLEVGVQKLTDGCPYHCTYCSVGAMYKGFQGRPLQRTIAEFSLLEQRGVQHIAFYDDALLYRADTILIPYLDAISKTSQQVSFHCPNALNARFITRSLARALAQAGFKSLYLGFESQSRQWQETTGSKIFAEEFAQAVHYLKEAGISGTDITAYQILGHPKTDMQELEASMQCVHDLGIRGMLADFSPIPGTPDGDICSQWVDLSEPLMHNKTAFPILRFGFDAINRLKDLQRQLNHALEPSG
jgi:hypothetical protein